MEENTQQPAPQPETPVVTDPQVTPAKTVKKPDEEFSIAWHLKVLAVIYAVLAVFYVILKLTLK